MTLALVDDDEEFSEFLCQHLREVGMAVRRFGDSNDLLIDRAPYDFGFYVVDLSLPGVDGIDLIRLLRRRTSVGILVVSGRLDAKVFDAAITAGADMYLAKPVRFEQVALCIQAIQRRVPPPQGQVAPWRLDRQASELVAPDGARIPLSGTDLVVMECFAEANGSAVTWDKLRERLGRPRESTSDNALHASIYRLRKRVEGATPSMVPLQSLSRIGYVFRAPVVLS